MAQQKFGRIKRVAVLQGLAQISWIEGRNDKYTQHRIHRAVNNRNVDIAYSN